MLTAVFLPATLVTGFFGMNTKGLPHAEDDKGTLFAFAVMIAAAAITYVLLRFAMRRGASRGPT